MLVTALLAGSALLGIVFTFVVRFELAGFERARRLGIPAIRILLAVGLVGSLVLARPAVFAGLMSDDAALHGATMALVSGPLAIPFWVRLDRRPRRSRSLLIALPATRTVIGTGIAAGLAFVGVFVDRLLFVTAGQIIPTTAVGGVVSDDLRRLHARAWSRSASSSPRFAFVAFVYTLAERYLDLREAEVHLGFHLPGLVATRASAWPPGDRGGAASSWPTNRRRRRVMIRRASRRDGYWIAVATPCRSRSG